MPTDSAAQSARARFQSGLLAWLRQPGDPSGLREMIAVLRDLAGAADSGQALVWRSAEAFLASLLDGRLSVDDGARQMCRRIERQLTALGRGDSGDEELHAALFAYLSGRAGGSEAPSTTAVGDLGGLQKMLAHTAEILPLIAGAVRPRHAAEQLNAWLAAVRKLDDDWQNCLCRRSDDCRQAATALVGVSLSLNTPACLQLAEALANACAVAESPTLREDPQLRAAIAAALEIAGDRDGPNHPHFDQRAAAVVRRLDLAAAGTR